MPFKLRYYHQRATRGWSDADVWSLDSYLARVIAGSCRRLRDTTIGYPTEIYDRSGKAVDGTPELWRSTMARIIDGMELVAVEDEEDIPEDHWESHKKRKRDALLLLAYNFGSLWD
jgi:hypothetical protein